MHPYRYLVLVRAWYCLARVVLQDNDNSATSLVSELHWLPVSKWINFKIASLAYQSLAFGQPTYLLAVLTPHQPQRSSAQLIRIYLCHTATAVLDNEVFSYCAPKIWNDIPLSVRQSPSLDSFKRNLKTHYFANNWPPGDCLQRLWSDILDTVRSTHWHGWMDGWMDGRTDGRTDGWCMNEWMNHMSNTWHAECLGGVSWTIRELSHYLESSSGRLVNKSCTSLIFSSAFVLHAC